MCIRKQKCTIQSIVTDLIFQSRKPENYTKTGTGGGNRCVLCQEISADFILSREPTAGKGDSRRGRSQGTQSKHKSRAGNWDPVGGLKENVESHGGGGRKK